MSYIKELETLVKTDILPELSEDIKNINEKLAKKKKQTLEEELDYLLQVKKYFDEVLLDVENNTITEDQALDILDGLEDMKIENQI